MYVDEIISFFYFELRLCVCLIYEFSCVHGRHEIQYIESSVVSLIRSLPFLSLLTFELLEQINN